ncbi:MAG: hypothetical protein IPF93_23100 [Saprospiraceae bacterium]|nr:hypothetical protein [Saprospiraceae bacterium]
MILFDFRSISFFSIFLFSGVLTGQSVQWDRDSSLQAGLPQGMEIYYNHQPLEGAPFRGYFAKIDLLDKKLDFDVDTTQGRRLTPSQFYDRLDSPPWSSMARFLFRHQSKSKHSNRPWQTAGFWSYNHQRKWQGFPLLLSSTKKCIGDQSTPQSRCGLVVCRFYPAQTLCIPTGTPCHKK